MRINVRKTPHVRFLPILVALAVLLFLFPYLEGRGPQAIILNVAFALVLLGGIYVAGRRLWQVAAAAAVAMPWVIVGLWAPNGPWRPLGDASEIAFALLALLVVLHELLAARKVTADLLCGAAAAYVLIGVVWCFVYVLIEDVVPGSYRTLEAHAPGPVTWPDLMYFSFATLSSTGYGDITPASSPARSMAISEMAIGNLYLAVLIARLMSLYTQDAGAGEGA